MFSKLKKKRNYNYVTTGILTGYLANPIIKLDFRVFLAKIWKKNVCVSNDYKYERKQNVIILSLWLWLVEMGSQNPHNILWYNHNATITENLCKQCFPYSFHFILAFKLKKKKKSIKKYLNVIIKSYHKYSIVCLHSLLIWYYNYKRLFIINN